MSSSCRRAICAGSIDHFLTHSPLQGKTGTSLRSDSSWFFGFGNSADRQFTRIGLQDKISLVLFASGIGLEPCPGTGPTDSTRLFYRTGEKRCIRKSRAVCRETKLNPQGPRTL